ncbi:DUF4349 domain-containing protein [Chitinophaga nivalis]|uniref:DUF4349 domain-containing protein n=1 Tax=Chitinophaga nivalis TaxID=2991709 RepID=A0ABT3IPL6_9BACT|nr:DUF4349 domain-containing protein [Chitinophaga nivalis]MCW3464584.1 DUF4349 domain-containing protein [Chitinophaga nivalis]MCW3485725.1 DUF4349 domain-containing protein [Chitinophaga nivalis]
MRYTFFYLVPMVALFACSARVNNAEDAQTTSGANAAEYLASADSTGFSHNMQAINGASRKRVRTATIKCRVNNVFQATSRLEQLVQEVSGVVVESNLQNAYVREQELPYSADSLKKVQLYTPTAGLTLKVPADKLDAVVRALTDMSSFIDSRLLKDQDMTLLYLGNALKNQAQKMDTGKIVPGKTATALDVADYKATRQEQAIDRKMNNLEILDNVAYATLDVQLFQPEVADIQIVVNPAQVSQASFGTALLTAFRSGGGLFRGLILFVIEIWPVWLIIGAAYFGYRKWTGLKKQA